MLTVWLRELKRRRVLHTASLYVVGAWVALQVVEVLTGAGLPPSTMRKLLTLLSLGFPVALVIGWFFDISKDGIHKTGRLKPGEQYPEIKFFDHVLLAGLVFVIVLDAYILSLPPPDETPHTNGLTSQQRILAVLGFEDLERENGGDPVGDAFAGELRNSLTRAAGLRVLGPETSKVLGAAVETRLALARELSVTAMLLGEVILDGSLIDVRARLVGVPGGKELWSTRVAAPVAEMVSLQNSLVSEVLGIVTPGLHLDPLQGPRVGATDCNGVYDLYLRGKQLTEVSMSVSPTARERGVQLLRDAVAANDRCAVAWEAIAVASVNWDMAGFARAGAAARRALELNEALPEAWAVLAEIAEEEQRWNESEEFFLRALYADPTNAHANAMYSEALLARGRVKEALHYALEAYRIEPAYWRISWRVSLTAFYNGDGDMVIEYIDIASELLGKWAWWQSDLRAEGYLLKGDTERALENFSRFEDRLTDWFVDCVRARDDPGLIPRVSAAVGETLANAQHTALDFFSSWQVVRCSAWIGDPEAFFELMVDSAEQIPTEVVFINLFHPEMSHVRRDPRFRELVVDSGLLDYWRQWGWSDYCEPDGDDFRCD